jgi:hypothetical protein
MAREIDTSTLEQVKLHAVHLLTPAQAQRTNLSVKRQIIESGEEIGPANQRITIDEPSLVVFADDDPRANWGHSCRYLLYDPESGAFRREIQARLPIGGLEPFYTPVEPGETLIPSNIFWPPPRFRCPIIIPDGNRYALLFSGFTMQRHLNDLEFCYRTLKDIYAVPPENIVCLSFDGTLTVVNDDWTGSSAAPSAWPGDGTPYQIAISGQGTLAALQGAFSLLASKLGPDDLLFIHTNNHGDNDSTGSYLGYPASFPAGSNVYWGGEWVNLYASTFAGLLGTLPRYRALIVMMEQCNSGGFGPSVLSSSTAAATSFAAAASATASSYGATYLGAPWDAFAYQWIAAMAGHYPNGTPLVSNPDIDGSSVVDVSDAFYYANTNDTAGDSPNMSSAGPDADQLALAEEYIFIWFWCYLWRSIAPPYYNAVLRRQLTLTEFYSKLNEAARALQGAIVAESDEALLNSRRKLSAQISEALRASFE